MSARPPVKTAASAPSSGGSGGLAGGNGRDGVHRGWAYVLAVAVPLAIVGCRLAIGYKAGDAPMLILFLMPSLVCAYLGGLGPGLTATAASALLTDYFLLKAPGGLPVVAGLESPQWVMLILFGSLISVLTETLRKSSQRYRAILESSLDALIVINHEGRIEEFSPAAERMFGHSAATVLGKEMGEVIVPAALRTRHRSDMAHYLATGEAPVLDRLTEMTAMRADGTEFPVEISIQRIGVFAPPLFTGFIRDITERKQREEALRKSEERFRQLTENIHEVFWMTDPAKNQMLYISPAYATIWGRTCASLYANPHNWFDAVHPADRERVLRAAVTKQTRGDYDETYRIVRPDGTVRWIHDKAYPVAGPDGAVFRVVGVAEDVTDYRALEEQLRRGQRVEAIGSLANGIAHDLNNILAPVLMAPALLKETARSEHERQLLDLIEQSARRGANIVRQLLTFSRGAGGERVPVQLRHLVKEMVDIMQETFPRDIVIADHTARDLRPVSGDPTQLHQVIMNLCVNARDAMPNGGELTLTVKNEELSEADVQAHRPAKAGPHVALTVADTGHGMPPETIERIFDPFFTTKAPGKGTGLGLATVQGIVRSHEGFVTVSSAPGRGATFTIHLPASRDAAGAVTAPEPDQLPCGHDELVLVVDDEPAIREATRLLLEKHRYRVLAAGHGQEALEIFLENRDAVRLVLTDLMMPVMDGVSLSHTLRAIAPQLKLIATSGLIDQEKYAELKAAGVTTILKKPCSSRELLEAVARELAAAK